MSAARAGALAEGEVEAVINCLREGWLTMGPRTAAFEQALARRLEAPDAVSVSSSLAALHLALLVAGAGPGAEVLAPAFGFPGALAAIRLCGATPVLVDVRSPSLPELDAHDLAGRIGPRARVVVVGHFAGHPAPLARARGLCEKHGLVLVEDATQALGARHADGRPVGGTGDLACFSLSAGSEVDVGEGGAIVTADDEQAERLRRLRAHGMTSGTWERHAGHAPTYDVLELGFNYRLDEPRAALGLARLGRFERRLRARAKRARRLRERLAEVPGVDLSWEEGVLAGAAHFAVTLTLPDRPARERLAARLRAEGVWTLDYPAPAEDEAYAHNTPRAEEAAARLLAVGLQPGDEGERALFAATAALVGRSSPL